MIANISFIANSLFCNSNQRLKSNSNMLKQKKRSWTKKSGKQETRNSVFLLLQRTLKANALCWWWGGIPPSPHAHLFCSTSPLHPPTWEGFKLSQTLPLCCPRLFPARHTQKLQHYCFLPLWNHVCTSLSIIQNLAKVELQGTSKAVNEINTGVDKKI